MRTIHVSVTRLLAAAAGFSRFIPVRSVSWLGACFLSLTVSSGRAQLSENIHTLHHFDAINGMSPQGGLVISGSTIYGTTVYAAVGVKGGTCGIVFKLDTEGRGYTEVKRLDGWNGCNPRGRLILSGSKLYGTSWYGGSADRGAIFCMGTDGTGHIVLKSFSGITGERPLGDLVLEGSTFYGMTSEAGNNQRGTIFKLDTDGNNFSVLMHFPVASNSAAGHPCGNLQVSDGVVYGSTTSFRTEPGCIFKFDLAAGSFMPLQQLTTDAGTYSAGSILVNGTNVFGTVPYGTVVGAVGSVFKMNTDGTGFTFLKHFAGPDGRQPSSPLLLYHSMLYGTTEYGGSHDKGTLYQIKTDGTCFQVLKNFEGHDGANPCGALARSEFVLYGTTRTGGEYNYGVVFREWMPLGFLDLSVTGFSLMFSFESEEGADYTIEATDNLASMTWEPVHSLTGDGSRKSCTLGMSNSAAGFFRLRQTKR